MSPRGGGLQLRRCMGGVSPHHRRLRSWNTTRADRPTRISDTKPPCHVAHARVTLSGVSIAHTSGDKPLLLWQGTRPNGHEALMNGGGTSAFFETPIQL